MQKKLMTVAVAGALGAIGSTAAWAQASSVQIYGTISTSLEWAEATGASQGFAPATATGGSSFRNVAGNSRAIGGNYAATGVPAANKDGRTRVASSGSNFGIRGREDLGNGLYAGFQAEAAITLGGNSAQSSGTGGTVATWRNTGLWLGNNRFGEIGWGMWDTPINQNMGLSPAHAAYANASTTMVAGLLGTLSGGAAGGTISGYTVDAQCNPNFTAPAATLGATVASNNLTFGNSPATCFNWGTSFHRRQSNSFWYQSPSWAGFRARLHWGAENNQSSNSNATGNGVGGKLEPWLFGAGVSYTLGGLYAGLGYEFHNDYTAMAARTYGGMTLGGVPGGPTFATIPSGATGIKGSSDWAWNANLRYTFGFGLSLGGYYEQLRYDNNFNSGAVASSLKKLERDAWRLDGAYQLGPHTFGLQYGQSGDIKGDTIGQGFNGNATGTSVWILAYAYSMSKRTSLFGYATIVDNDANAASNGIVFHGIGPSSGADPRYYGFGLRHLF
jgi:predicted porin